MSELQMTLRRERKSDWQAVEQVTYRAFVDFPIDLPDNGTEAALVQKMRVLPAFVRELDTVAEVDGRIVGSIMYLKGRVVSEKGAWDILMLTIISVLPRYQRRGVGTALIAHTLRQAKAMGFGAVLIFGHEGYYPRFGFKPAAEYGITDAEGNSYPALMALPLAEGALDGISGRLIEDAVMHAATKAEADALNVRLAAPMDIDEYIAAQPEALQPILHAIRRTIRACAPNAQERLSWQMPTFWQGENLIHFAVASRHIGLYPGDEAVAAFEARLSGYVHAKGSIRLPLDQPIDLELIADVTRFRVAQVEGRG
jgi:predicted N-acetyltransferase YhbS/uncharacterized protein YdhG (YjbR/CyaY superfamily)